VTTLKIQKRDPPFLTKDGAKNEDGRTPTLKIITAAKHADFEAGEG